MGNLIFGILMIIGGVSGTMVLRGTGSPTALIVVGVVMCFIGFGQISADGKQAKSRGKTGRVNRRDRGDGRDQGGGRPVRAARGKPQRGQARRSRR